MGDKRGAGKREGQAKPLRCWCRSRCRLLAILSTTPRKSYDPALANNEMSESRALDFKWMDKGFLLRVFCPPGMGRAGFTQACSTPPPTTGVPKMKQCLR